MVHPQSEHPCLGCAACHQGQVVLAVHELLSNFSGYLDLLADGSSMNMLRLQNGLCLRDAQRQA